ncbi:RNA polymerase sigma-70 factor (ECF subfamily) [Anseongella ginsenosidimutans]|uniref:RNA polymerase sigma-70 factor (ECF subfamily) n=1 Tax=Anseongella ginsenosidimutans TaxID=496056 RepID=A0A4R3KMD2_9SPHI|nr:sigma-70 family RNA polymerase sigma factor [Anseongella ginsenosidimutans]QEC53796.1 sigma-70 family RNA polymerase sigma factor [Anseongella ginsenosidimutans]TCS84940.1 RNA polymerase sigma-70 factor (ECF subfamily) [Anseongella ginsenosidimutans]
MDPNTPYKEQELVEGLLQKKRSAAEILYDRYGKSLYGIILNIVREEEIAEDLLQEALMKIWGSIQTYDRNKGTLFTWMLNISRNLAIDKVRSKNFRNDHQNRPLESAVHSIDLQRTNLPFTESIGLKELVSTLRTEHQEVINLVYFQGYTQAEAAKELDIPLGTAKTHLRNGILSLRKLFNVDHRK